MIAPTAVTVLLRATVFSLSRFSVSDLLPNCTCNFLKCLSVHGYCFRPCDHIPHVSIRLPYTVCASIRQQFQALNTIYSTREIVNLPLFRPGTIYSVRASIRTLFQTLLLLRQYPASIAMSVLHTRPLLAVRVLVADHS